ncbi:MAG: VWA domain-containing protein, partial [Gammaproteobacteria bacterium]|nr:VWA domain-containing protein [Gammaproteobacteria bacterium]
MRKRRETDSFSVSFLDVMSCGFGAIILLLMITKNATPVIIEYSDLSPEGSVNELREQLFAIRGETTILNRDLNAKQEQLSAYR